MGAAVQFLGKEATLKAFEKRDLVKWSLWGSGKMIVAYEGTDESESRTEFEDWLTMMRNNTTAMYTVKFYDKSVKQIRPTTEEMSAFIFRLAEEQPYYGGAMNGTGAGMGAIETMFNKISARMDEFDKKLVKQPPEEEPLETWEKLIDHPLVMAGIGKMLNLDMGAIMSEAGKISGVPGMAVDDKGTIQEIVDDLKVHDPKIREHLIKLLDLAEKMPSQFKLLIGMLESMVIKK